MPTRDGMVTRFKCTIVHLVGVLVLVLVSVATSEAQCFPYIEDAVLDSPFHYMVAFADALSDVKSAEQKVPESTANEVQIMVGLCQAKADFKCAESRVARYQK